MDMSEWVPRAAWGELMWLAKLKQWCEFHRDAETVNGEPRSVLSINSWVFTTAPGWERMAVLRTWFDDIRRRETPLVTAYLEAVTAMFRDGPKLFHPSDEQFTSMEQVELGIAPADFYSPYPALSISVPGPVRARLAKTYGVELAGLPRAVLVRDNREPWNDHAVYVVLSSDPTNRVNEHYLFMEHPENNPVERALNRYVDSRGNVFDGAPDAMKRVSIVVARAALNLCMMLTHYGHRLGGPNNPNEYTRHRTKKHLQHLAHGDFTTVQMTQNIVVRAPSPPANNPPGLGMGHELKPHWRKGHWRCYPGMASERAAGVRVPLLFVRPALVRADRAAGDMGESRVDYHG